MLSLMQSGREEITADYSVVALPSAVAMTESLVIGAECDDNVVAFSLEPQSIYRTP